MATNLFIEVANQKGINSLTDANPIVPPDLSPPGTYQFNNYYLDFGPPDTYHRYASAAMELNIRQNGPPLTGSFTLTFLGYTTDPIDIKASNEDILSAFTALRSVGDGNAQISGNAIDGRIIEFIGIRAGLAQAAIICDAINCAPASTSVVKQIQAGGNGLNSRQLIDINQDRVATTNLFTEIGVPATPGWTTSSGLSTSGVSQSFWQSPVYDIVLEVKLFIAGSRSGTDGITSQLAARAGSDGVTTDDGRGRSGADGTTTNSPGFTSNCSVYQGDKTITYNAPTSGRSRNPSRPFIPSDIGRSVTGTYIQAGAVITALSFPIGTNDANGNPQYNGAILSYVSTLVGNPVAETVSFGSVISNQYQSASANFTQADVGHPFTGTSIPSGTTITSVINSTTVQLSANPTAAGSGLAWTIAAIITNKYTSASASFTSSDIGRSISGTNIETNTQIATVIDSQNVTLTIRPTAAGTGLSWSIPASAGRTYQSATANFTQADVGKIISGANLPSNATIITVVDSSHCTISQTPTAAGTGLSWTILNTTPGSSGLPIIARIQAGTSSLPEIQRLAFAEIPDYGSFTITLNGVTTTPIAGPVTALAIQSALNAGFPNQGQFNVVAKAKCVFDITFGVNGSQNLFTADDTNLVYDNVVLRLVLVNGVGTIIHPNQVPDAKLLYDGDFSREYACGAIREESIPNTGGAKIYRQRFIQLAANRRGRALNSAGPFGSVLIQADSCQDLGGGVVEWDYVWVTLPPNRVDDIWGSRTYEGNSKTFSNGVLLDQATWSISVSNMLKRFITYSVGYPRWSSGGTPAGVIVHFKDGSSIFLGFNGYDTGGANSVGRGTFGAAWNWSVNITRWMGDIWQMEIVNG